MKLCMFTVGWRERIGFVIPGDQIVDLKFAYAAFLAERGEAKAYELAEILIPPNVIGFIEGGSSSWNAAREVESYIKTGKKPVAPRGGDSCLSH